MYWVRNKKDISFHFQKFYHVYQIHHYAADVPVSHIVDRNGLLVKN